MFRSKRKTPFVGLLCDINSVISIYEDLVAKPNASLQYLLTYKLSQDHIELFLELFVLRVDAIITRRCASSVLHISAC